MIAQTPLQMDPDPNQNRSSELEMLLHSSMDLMMEPLQAKSTTHSIDTSETTQLGSQDVAQALTLGLRENY